MQRAYVRYVLRMGAVLADDSHISHDADTCDVHQNAEPSSKEIDAVLRFVQSYEGPLRVIDARRQKLGKTGDLTAARALQPERDRIVAEAVRSLPGFVGKESAGKIDLYVRAKFKKSTKIFL